MLVGREGSLPYTSNFEHVQLIKIQSAEDFGVKLKNTRNLEIGGCREQMDWILP